MMKSIYTFVLATVLFSACQNKTNLVLNLEEGEVYNQHSTVNMVMSQEFMGQKMDMDMVIEGEMSFKVNGKEGDNYDMEVQYVLMSINMQMPQGNMIVSSENPGEDDILSQLLSAMTETPFQCTMSNLGKVVEVKNMEAVWENAINKFPELPLLQKQQLQEQVMKSFGEESFKGSMDQWLAIYPSKAVEVEDSWVIETKLQSGITADINTTFSYVGEIDGYYGIHGEGNISTSPEDTMKLTALPVRYDLTGTSVADIKIDKQTGWIAEANIVQKFSGDSYFGVGEEEMKMPMQMSTEAVITDK